MADDLDTEEDALRDVVLRRVGEAALTRPEIADRVRRERRISDEDLRAHLDRWVSEQWLFRWPRLSPERKTDRGVRYTRADPEPAIYGALEAAVQDAPRTGAEILDTASLPVEVTRTDAERILDELAHRARVFAWGSAKRRRYARRDPMEVLEPEIVDLLRDGPLTWTEVAARLPSARVVSPSEIRRALDRLRDDEAVFRYPVGRRVLYGDKASAVAAALAHLEARFGLTRDDLVETGGRLAPDRPTDR